MRQSIRVLGWTITIVTILVVAFLAISVYSLMQMVLVNQGIRPSDFRYEVSNGTFIVSLALSVNNTSYFDISELNVVTVLKDPEGVTISNGTSRLGRIPSGDKSTIRHNLTVNISDMLGKNLTHLLLDASVGLRYANLLGFQITVSNMSIPLRAQFSSSSIGESSASRSITETVRLVSHQSTCSSKIQIEASLSSLRNYAGSCHSEVSLETSGFHLEPLRIPYG